MTAEQYVVAIVKKVKCSGEKRKDIKKQLLSDVLMALDHGETLEDVTKRMGSAEEVAEEFNRNLPEAEQRKYTRSKKVRTCCIVLFVLLCLVLVVYWMLPKNTKFGKSGLFEKNVVEEQVKWVIERLDENDFEALGENSVEEMKQALNPETIEEARMQTGTDWGEFQSFGNTYLSEYKQKGQIYVVAQTTVVYENINITYTILFDKDMKLAGLYMK